MRQLASNSFGYSEPDDIVRVEVLEHLVPYQYNQTPRQGGETWACAWAPDFSYFAWSCGKRQVQLIPWDNKKNRIADESDYGEYRHRHVLDCGEIVWSMAFGVGKSSAGTSKTWRRLKLDHNLLLATGLQSGRIKLWNCTTENGKCHWNLMLELLDHKDVVRDMDFAPDKSLHLVSASRDGTLKLWDLNQDGNMYRTLRSPCKWINSCRWSPNKKLLASTGNNKCALLWAVEDVHNVHILRKLEGHYHDVVSCEFSPDGALLATASYDTKVIIWDTCTGDSVREFGHLFPPPRPIYAGGANDHYVRGLSITSDGTTIASISDDGFVRFWDINQTGDPEMICEQGNALCCSFSPGGTVLAVGTRFGSVTFYSSGKQVPSLLHLARGVIRRNLQTTKVDHLHLPIRLKEFLKYLEM